MKTLKDVIYESILDDYDKLSNGIVLGDAIQDFLNTNYTSTKPFEISKKLNKDGKLTVSCKGEVSVKNRQLKSLTNEFFVFKEVDVFRCCHIPIQTLEGAPTKCREFDCTGCSKLSNLNGAPKEVGRMICSQCFGLESLEGVSRKVMNIDLSHCTRLTSLQGLPSKIYDLDISFCFELDKSNLKYMPKNINVLYGVDNCSYTKQEIMKQSRITELK